jgi:hypothetical protein
MDPSLFFTAPNPVLDPELVRWSVSSPDMNNSSFYLMEKLMSGGGWVGDDSAKRLPGSVSNPDPVLDRIQMQPLSRDQTGSGSGTFFINIPADLIIIKCSKGFSTPY